MFDHAMLDPPMFDVKLGIFGMPPGGMSGFTPPPRILTSTPISLAPTPSNPMSSPTVRSPVLGVRDLSSPRTGSLIGSAPAWSVPRRTVDRAAPPPRATPRGHSASALGGDGYWSGPLSLRRQNENVQTPRDSKPESQSPRSEVRRTSWPTRQMIDARKEELKRSLERLRVTAHALSRTH